MIHLKALRYAFRLWGSRNWYQGIDRPTLKIMTDHITEKKVESEGKVFNKNRGKTVSKSKVFSIETTVTITKHLD